MRMDAALLVMRKADMVVDVPGTDFEHHCGACGATVAISPAGQRLLLTMPALPILCTVCARRDPDFDRHQIILAPGVAEEIMGFLRRN